MKLLIFDVGKFQRYIFLKSFFLLTFSVTNKNLATAKVFFAKQERKHAGALQPGKFRLAVAALSLRMPHSCTMRRFVRGVGDSMGKKTRTWTEVAADTASSFSKKVKRFAGNLAQAPLGLDIVARQYLATNYRVKDYHDGSPTAMYSGFKARLVDALGEGFDLSAYQGFAHAEQFAKAHWRDTGFSRADNTRGVYAANIWLRDRGNGLGTRESPVMSELRQALLDDPAAPSLFKPETIPTEKVDLLELLRETRESAAEPPSAQDDDGAKWRV